MTEDRAGSTQKSRHTGNHQLQHKLMMEEKLEQSGLLNLNGKRLGGEIGGHKEG